MATVKSLTLVLFLTVAPFCVSGQNWTATDIDGVTHTLQDYLDQGKTVLVDVSAYWCIPCWGWHKSGVMDKLYEEFGPEGTDDLMIFFVDGDANSTLALLQGGAGSVGDWTAGSHYPIIGPGGEGHQVATAYGVFAYPTLFIHCPGSITGEVIAPGSTWEPFLTTWRDMCPGALVNGAINANLLEPQDHELCPGEHPVADVFNQGTGALTDALIELKQNGNVVETINWTGSIAPFAHAVVPFNTTVVTGQETFEEEITVTGDMDPLGDVQELELSVVPDATSALVTIEIRTDNNANETSWRLLNSGGAIVAQDPPGSYADNTTYTYNLALNTNECYTLRMQDQAGDGVCCAYGNGYFKLRNTWGPASYFIEGGEFITFTEERGFMTPATVGVEDPGMENGLELFPNPTADIVRLGSGTVLRASTDVRVYNALGDQVMRTTIPASGAPVLDLGSLENGAYMIVVESEGLRRVGRITLLK